MKGNVNRSIRRLRALSSRHRAATRRGGRGRGARSVVRPEVVLVVVVVVRVRAAEVGVVHLVVGQRRPVVADPAVAHHDSTVDQPGQRPELVGDQHHGGAALLEPAQGPGERDLVGQVDAGGRLVEEEQLGLAGQCPRDQRALLLAARQRGAAVVGPVAQPDHLEGVVDGGPVGPRERAQQAAPGEPPGGDHLAHGGGHARGGPGALRHEADPLPVREAVQRRAEELDGAGGQRHATRSAPGPAWTCRSRWHPSARRTRRARPAGRGGAGPGVRRC